MKKYLLLSILMIALNSFNFLSAQFELNVPTTTLCADGITAVTAFEGWQAYQTLNGSYDGITDVEHCINMNSTPYHITLAESEMDITKPVFLHWHSDIPVNLIPNYLLNIYINISNFEAIDLTNIEFCDDGVCQGFIVKTQVPDDPDDADELPEIRIHNQEFELNNLIGGIAPLCLPTEYFADENGITDLYLKFQFVPNFGSVVLNNLFMDYVWDASLLDNVSLPQYQNGQFDYYSSYGNLLVAHDEGTFPNLENITYLDLTPEPNVDVQSTVTFSLYEMSSLSFQPYTGFRGGLVLNSDELRHNYIIENNGADFCMNYFLELVFDPGSQFVFNAGKMSMSWGTCMRFEPGSTLHVGENTTLQYGQQGMGMLAMQSGSNILLEKNAVLSIDNALRLFNAEWQDEIENIHVYLNQGQSLVFGEYASINNISTAEKMKIVVHLQGGFIDISNLDTESLKHIEFRYVQENESLALLSILGNPVQEDLSIHVHSITDSNATINLFDAQGRSSFSAQVLLQAGFNSIAVDTSFLPVGCYTLMLKTDAGQIVNKIVKG